MILPEPYYQDDARCACGCGYSVAVGRQYISGHNLRNLRRTEQHSRKIGEAQKRAWSTKRRRLPIGSKNHDANGYVRVKIHRGAGKWEKEHILVMEKQIGRKLRTGECVHHINGDRADNRIENLYLCNSTSHHSRVDQSIKKLLKALMAVGIVRFNTMLGGYEIVATR